MSEFGRLVHVLGARGLFACHWWLYPCEGT